KLVMKGSFNTKAFKTTMAKTWKIKGELEIKDVKRNLLTFRFQRQNNMVMILEHGPWNFDWKFLVLHKLSPDKTPRDISLTKCPFWIRVNDVTLSYQNVEMA
ncbi:hypothetical protein glysoja_047518, partial [Glycine soja]